MAQMALLWTVRDPVVTSALIGASRPEQVRENVAAFNSPALTEAELQEIETILAEE